MSKKSKIDKIRQDEDAYAFIDLICKDCPAAVRKYWKVYVDENGALTSDPEFEDKLRITNVFFKNSPELQKAKGWDDADNCVFEGSPEEEDLQREIEDRIANGASQDEIDELENKVAIANQVEFYIKEAFKQR